MEVTKLYQKWVKILVIVADLIKAFQELEEEKQHASRSLVFRNIVALCHAGADGLLILVRRGEKELAGDNVKPGIQGPLFPDTPQDRAAVQADIREMVETWFTSAYQRDDSGKPPEPKREKKATPPPEASEAPAGKDGGLAARIKAAVHPHGEAGLTFQSIGALFDKETHERFGADVVEMTVWAMIHIGELVREGEDGASLVATTDALEFDVMGMLEATPSLGTEAGPPADVDLKILRFAGAAPPLADAVSVLIHEKGIIDRAALVAHFDNDEAEVQAATDYLASENRIEGHVTADPKALGIETDAETVVVFTPFYADGALDDLGRDALAALYRLATGQDPGKKKGKTLARGIVEARAEAAAAAEVPSQDVED